MIGLWETAKDLALYAILLFLLLVYIQLFMYHASKGWVKGKIDAMRESSTRK